MPIEHTIKANGSGKTKVVNLNVILATLAHCKECGGFNRNEGGLCREKFCALYPFRTWDTPQISL